MVNETVPEKARRAINRELGVLQEGIPDLLGPLRPAVDAGQQLFADLSLAISDIHTLLKTVDEKTKRLGVQFLVSQLLWTVCQVAFYGRYSSLLSALESKVASDLYREFVIQSTLQAVCSAAWSYQALRFNELSLSLRRSLTAKLVGLYLSRKLYYKAKKDEESEQVLSREVKVFAESVLNIVARIIFPGIRVAILINFVAPVTSKVSILLSLYAVYMFGVIVYASLDFDSLKRKRDNTQSGFEKALVRVEDSAESLAFYRGELIERDRILQKADGAIRATSRFLEAMFVKDLFTFVNCDIVLLFPLVIFSPEYFSGQIDIAGMMYIKHMFYQTYEAVTLFPGNVEHCKSLYTSREKLMRILRAEKHTKLPMSLCDQETEDGTLFRIKGISVKFPGEELPVIDHGNFWVERGERIYIAGENGAGKTTLFRACARLLDSETTKVDEYYSIDQDRLLFLPQKSYMLASATLREQLLFPRWKESDEDRPDDDQLIKILEELKFWEKKKKKLKKGSIKEILSSSQATDFSGGETQLIGFARLMVVLRHLKNENKRNGTNQPVIAFLDEATSALFPEREAIVYGLLQKECDTFVSIGHRKSVRAFHNRFVTIPEDLHLLPPK